MNKSYFMARGRVLRIEDAAETVLHVRSGALWLTQEGDRRDYYLPQGSSFRLSRDGLAIAQATRASTVILAGGRAAHAQKARTLMARLTQFWAALYAPHSRPSTAGL